jgi:hypothetical protein
MSVNLHKLAEEFRGIQKETKGFHYVDRRNNQIFTVLYYQENLYEKAKQNPAIVPFPEEFKLQEYELMEIFARTQPERQNVKLLLQAANGKKSFLKFREVVKTLGLKDDWFKFRHLAWCDYAANWCRLNHIPYKPQLDETVLRRATPDDTNMVVNLLANLYFHTPESIKINRADFYAKNAELLANPEHAMFLALKESHAIGVAHCAVYEQYAIEDTSSLMGYMQAVYVEPEHQKNYVQCRLSAACVKWAAEQGCRHFTHADGYGSYIRY